MYLYTLMKTGFHGFHGVSYGKRVNFIKQNKHIVWTLFAHDISDKVNQGTSCHDDVCLQQVAPILFHLVQNVQINGQFSQ